MKRRGILWENFKKIQSKLFIWKESDISEIWSRIETGDILFLMIYFWKAVWRDDNEKLRNASEKVSHFINGNQCGRKTSMQLH